MAAPGAQAPRDRRALPRPARSAPPGHAPALPPERFRIAADPPPQPVRKRRVSGVVSADAASGWLPRDGPVRRDEVISSQPNALRPASGTLTRSRARRMFRGAGGGGRKLGSTDGRRAGAFFPRSGRTSRNGDDGTIGASALANRIAIAHHPRRCKSPPSPTSVLRLVFDSMIRFYVQLHAGQHLARYVPPRREHRRRIRDRRQRHELPRKWQQETCMGNTQPNSREADGRPAHRW